ncbi:MAG: RNA methyltransferase [Acidobacteriota bacterium]|nr:RNA methyltransferase [Acidobacteriota bacterium]
MPIVSVQNSEDTRLADYRDVPDPVLLRERGLFVAESRFVVRELLQHPTLVTRSVLATAAAYQSLHDLLDPARVATVPVFVAPHQLLKEPTGFRVHRGCLAIGERPTLATDSGLPALGRSSLIIGLEQVGNPDNLGSIFRNAAAFGAGCVVLEPHCCDPLYRKAIRTSLGATLRVPYGEMPDWPDGLTRLRELGYTTVAMTLHPDAEDLESFARVAPARVAVLFGAEGPGLRDETLPLTDRRVRIPIATGIDSLNVATASGIALYALTARRGRPAPEPLRG